MELMLDTANLEEIKEGLATYPVTGVTSNPSILKNEGQIDFWTHMKSIRDIIGNRTLHVQVIATTYHDIIKEADRLLEMLGYDTYIKIPVSEEGLKAIKILSSRGVNVTATAIYTTLQGTLAMMAGAKYIAIYYTRMQNINIDAATVVKDLAYLIDKNHFNCKLLAASFKDVSQLNSAYSHGAHSATVPLAILKKGMSMPSIQEAVTDFNHDWESIHGEGSSILTV